MELTIKYFGMLAEATNCKEEKLHFSKSVVSELIEDLCNKYPDLKTMAFQVAQDQEIISINTSITGSELALLPPFAGG